MKLKFKIDKAAYDKLDDAVKALYGEKDGSYVLQVEGAEGEDDIATLRRAKEREAQEAKTWREKAEAAQKELDESRGIDARKRGDIDTLEKSWKEKYDKREKELLEQVAKKDGYITKALLDGEASKLASSISNAPSVLLPHIKSRLTVDTTGEEPALRILDAQGKPSALTMDDLKKEFVANKDFAAIITVNKASGSGAAQGQTQKGQGGAPSSAANGEKPASFRQMSPQEQVAYLKQKKEQTANA